MSTTKFVATANLDAAVSLVLEQEPEQWGASEHLNCIRYLVLQISDRSKLDLAGIKALKPEDTLTIKWGDLRKELTQSGKLAECANFYKWLQESDEMKKRVKKTADYA